MLSLSGQHKTEDMNATPSGTTISITVPWCGLPGAARPTIRIILAPRSSLFPGSNTASSTSGNVTAGRSNVEERPLSTWNLVLPYSSKITL